MRLFLDLHVIAGAAHAPGSVCHELVLYSTGQRRGLEYVHSFTSERVLTQLQTFLLHHLRYRPEHAAQKVALLRVMLPLLPPATDLATEATGFAAGALSDALQGGCDYFITGDQAALQSFNLGPMRIVNPREAIDWLISGKGAARFSAHQPRPKLGHLKSADANTRQQQRQQRIPA